MAHQLTAEQVTAQSTLGEDARPWPKRLIGAGAVLLIAAIAWGWFGGEAMKGQFLFSYLVAFAWFTSISLGALFFTIIQHLVAAQWSIVVRRLAELLMTNLPVMALLSLPLLVPAMMGDHTLWHWMDHDAAAQDHVLHAKAGFLNVPFFLIRCALYFGIWFFLTRWFFKNSVLQDQTGDHMLSVKMRKVAAPAVILFALTTTFFAFDFLMALEAHWFSTIFGVYFFAGSALAFFSTMAIVTMLCQEKGKLADIVNTEHYHDIGKYMFAFTVFWGYIAFSQFMLIWYADIPEETYWYQNRLVGSWEAVSWFLLFGHLLIPLAGLLSRWVKRNKATLALWAVILLFMHWVDLYWIVMPTLHENGMVFSLMDVLCMAGIGCVFAGAWIARARSVSLAPVKDPFWERSLRFRNL
jgi:hypothetical protein